VTLTTEKPTSFSYMPKRTKIFADGADLDGIRTASANPLVKGFTTNPTLMRKAGIADYEKFAKEVLSEVTALPISFEVFSDEFHEMERQARLIASWGSNVFVKIPVTNTEGQPTTELVKRLSLEGIQLNVTALLTTQQVREVCSALTPHVPVFVSLFAGRIADAGQDPVASVVDALSILGAHPGSELIWASPREIYNLIQADELGCHVITLTNELIGKMSNLGRDLADYSLDTVQMFRRDAIAAGYRL
jgi:transaldolase